MPRSHHREVTAIQGRELGLAESFHDREHGRVHESDPEIAVCAEDLLDARVVGRSQVLYLVTAASIEER